MTKNLNETTQSPEERLGEMVTLLQQHGIPVESWNGTGGTKTPEDLFHELEEGETTLEIIEGKVLRTVNVVAVDITHTDTDGTVWKLWEARQVSKKDGSVKTRPDLRGAVAEKMKATENPQEAALRGASEELGIGAGLSVTDSELVTELKPTKTYPGLDTQYNIHVVHAEMSSDAFRPNNEEGYAYKEEQASKTTYFVWDEVKS